MPRSKRSDPGIPRETTAEEKKNAALALCGVAAGRKWKHETKVKQSNVVLQALLGPELELMKRARRKEVKGDGRAAG